MLHWHISRLLLARVSMNYPHDTIGEVVSSTISACIAHCWNWKVVAPYGSLVYVDYQGYRLFGIVYQAQAGVDQDNHRAYAHGLELHQLEKEQPQIFHFLQTKLSILMVGYEYNSVVYYCNCPFPAPVHGFITLADPEVLHKFTAHPDYLHLLLCAPAQIAQPDELILALVRYQKEQQVLTDEKLVELTRHVWRLFAGDYNRLSVLTQRLEQFTM